MHLWKAADRKGRKYNDARCSEGLSLSCEAVARRPTCWFSQFLIGVFTSLWPPTGSALSVWYKFEGSRNRNLENVRRKERG